MQESLTGPGKDVDSLGRVGQKTCVRTVVAAFKFLTLAGFLSAKNPPPEIVGKSAKYFIVAGLVLGLLLALSNYLLAPYLDTAILSLVLVAIMIAATAGRHLSGLKDSFAGLVSVNGRANEALGFAAVALVILFKTAAAESMDEIATSSWLLAPVIARWGLLIFLYGYHTRFDESARPLAEQINFPAVLAATIVTLTLSVYFLGRKGLWIALAVSIFTLALRGLFYRRHKAILPANFGAAVELCEALSLVLLASL